MANENKVMRFPDLKTIEAEAAEWLVRLDDEESSPHDYAEFQKWRSQSEQHREAFERLSRDWGGFDRLQELNDYAVFVGQDTVAKFRKQGVSRRSFMKYAASMVLAVGVAAIYSFFLPGNSQTYQTAVGERKSVELADGTIIELNTNSLVHSRYSRSTREIRLLRGEAYFEVAHDPSRPLSVHAGQGIVTVHGTAFTVHMRDERVDVVVSEGHVTLSIQDSLAPEQVTVVAEMKAGQDAALHQEKVEYLRDLDLEELTRKLSWRNGILSFKGEALSDVIADMSRYTDFIIEINDDELKKLPVDGYFRVGEIDTMIEALEIMADLQVEYRDGSYIRLSKRQEG